MEDTDFQKLQREVKSLSEQFDELSFNFYKKTGSGSETITGSELRSDNFLSGTQGWQLLPNGNVEFGSGHFRGDITGATGTFSGTVNIGSLNIPDTTTANSFHTDSNGNSWWGSPLLATSIANILNTGIATFKKITISGGSDVSFISDTLDTSTKTILGDFTFSSTGSIRMNTDSDNGLWISPTGILGKKSGNSTFSITTSGDATFAGTLTAASGTLGNITLASGGNIKMGQTAYNTGTGFWLGDASGTTKLSIGDGISAHSILWDGITLFVKGSSLNFENTFGNGDDGDTTLSVDTTLTRDMFYSALTINAGVTLFLNGFRIFCKGNFTNNGIIRDCASAPKNGGNGNNGGNGGNPGTGGAGGAGGVGGTVYGGIAGVAGSTGGNGRVFDGLGQQGGTGITGTAITAGGILGVGRVGVHGGGGGSAPPSYGTVPGGLAGTYGANTVSQSMPYNYNNAVNFYYVKSDGTIVTFKGYTGSGSGAGGSGGSAMGYNSGGAGGGGGGSGGNAGNIIICARTILNNGAIYAIGGNGGNGGNGGDHSGSDGTEMAGGGGGGAGGSAGNGGIIVLIYGTYTASGSEALSVDGGTGGTAGSPGVGHAGSSNGEAAENGLDGLTGMIIRIEV